jgi:hypothetical protein
MRKSWQDFAGRMLSSPLPPSSALSTILSRALTGTVPLPDIFFEFLRAGLYKGHLFDLPMLLFLLSAPLVTGSLLFFVAESTEASF